MTLSTNTNVYGKIAGKVSRDLVAAKINKFIGFKYPLEEDPSNGYFSKYSGLDLIKTSIRGLLKTERGERFMLPDYGCSLKRFLMEPIDEVTFDLIKKDIQETIAKYFSKVEVLKLQVFDTRQNILNVKLFCGLKEEGYRNINVELSI